MMRTKQVYFMVMPQRSIKLVVCLWVNIDRSDMKKVQVSDASENTLRTEVRKLFGLKEFVLTEVKE